MIASIDISVFKLQKQASRLWHVHLTCIDPLFSDLIFKKLPVNGQCCNNWTKLHVLVTTKHRRFIWLIVWTMMAGSPLQNWRQNCTGVACHGPCINSLNGKDSLKHFEYVCRDRFVWFRICSSLNYRSSCYKNTIKWSEFKDFKIIINE